ncbi:hypothetical protein [Atopococcus tabaci]|uniref:hypothetical protein n=1 Tax=Atopococcus tabaci TaxID=269774 RepID=UPI00047F6592|nr:hypothetical protein [Atopococcus tabaci]
MKKNDLRNWLDSEYDKAWEAYLQAFIKSDQAFSANLKEHYQQQVTKFRVLSNYLWMQLNAVESDKNKEDWIVEELREFYDEGLDLVDKSQRDGNETTEVEGINKKLRNNHIISSFLIEELKKEGEEDAGKAL